MNYIVILLTCLASLFLPNFTQGTHLYYKVNNIIVMHPTDTTDIDLAKVIIDESTYNKVDVFLVLALIKMESNFQNKIISSAGAVGLMQLIPGTALAQASKIGIKLDGVHQLHRPDINIKLGVSYLKDLLHRYNGNERIAITAYNCGPTYVETIYREQGHLILSKNGYYDTINKYRNMFSGL